MSAGSDAKKSPAGGGPAVPHCGPSGTCHESVPGFVQQQSQVFVFTTDLANDAAEAVKQGRCKSMIAYHMEQPATKQFLQVSEVFQKCIFTTNPTHPFCCAEYISLGKRRIK